MFQTILVATDGSDLAAKAIDIATDMSLTCRAKLIIVSVVEPNASSWLHALAAGEHDVRAQGRTHPILEGVPGWMDEAIGASANLGSERAFADELGKAVLGRAAYAAREKGVENVETQLAHGDVVESILSIAEAKRADLLVFGSRGLGAFRGLVLGSVSMKLHQLAPCPCLTVK